jgi:hypothetical protein
MEPRPQRPRPGQGSNRSQAQGTDRADATIDPAFETYEQQPYIAPPRTSYDYSPLDLAPPGQRRRRQLVAAAIGGLLVLLLIALGILGYLLITSGDDSDPSNSPTLNAQETVEPTAAETASTTAGDEATGESNTDEHSTQTSTETNSEDQSTAETGEEADTTPGGPTKAELNALQPGVEAMPKGIDAVSVTDLTFDEVLGALGGSRIAKQNLEKWGWSGNSGREWDPSDENALEPGATTTLFVSIHGFADADSAGEALVFFSDVLVEGSDYTEVDTPDPGDSARMLMTENDNGVIVALYVQVGNVMYRFGGFAPVGGDPTQDVLNLAEATLGGG